MTKLSLWNEAQLLPARVGQLPRMTAINPQEQLDQYPPDWRVIDQLAKFAFSLPNVVERPTQVAPDGARALNLPDALAVNLQGFLVAREFAHIHNHPTGSMHMVLPQPYRDLAIQKRWALRHPFAVRGLGPADAVFVFAPRDDLELAWAAMLLKVSHAWACGLLAREF